MQKLLAALGKRRLSDPGGFPGCRGGSLVSGYLLAQRLAPAGQLLQFLAVSLAQFLHQLGFHIAPPLAQPVDFSQQLQPLRLDLFHALVGGALLGLRLYLQRLHQALAQPLFLEQRRQQRPPGLLNGPGRPHALHRLLDGAHRRLAGGLRRHRMTQLLIPGCAPGGD